MPRYEVEVEYSETVTQTDWVTVEAEDEDEAADLAEGHFTYYDDVYVVGVEPLDED